MTILNIAFILLAQYQQLQFLPLMILVAVVVIFLLTLAVNRYIVLRIHKRSKESLTTHDLMQRAISISQSNVVRYDLRDKYIYRLYGHLLPERGLSTNEWKNHVHPDDLSDAVDWIQEVAEGRLPRADFYYRWDFNYKKGEAPQWGYIHNVCLAEYLPGIERPVAVISTLFDETSLHQVEEQENDLSNKYKLIFENTVIGLSFYSADGWLLDSNAMMRKICHFDSDDGDAFFSNTNLFDVTPFSECCDRHNPQELWICSHSVIPERDMHDYLEIRVHPLRDENGEIVYLAIVARDVTEERQMYLQDKLNDIQIRKANEAIQLYETELRYMMGQIQMQAFRISLDRNLLEFYSGLSTVVRSFTLEDMRQIFANQDDEFVKSLANPAEAFSKPMVYIGPMRPVVTLQKTENQWVQINSIPEYDEQGRMKGAFGVWRNINELMQKQDQLKRETERANDSGRMKSVFLANMTHEIRTPLNAIVGFSDLLQAVDSPDDKKEMIRVIHNNCDMLLRLINDILVLSNVDANAMQIVPEETDAAKAFDDLCPSLAQRVQEVGVEFIKDNPYSSVITFIDRARINQVFTNFVTNAVKYTQQGHIRVGFDVQEREGRSGFYAYCEDTGTGIPADQKDRIFERFVKLNDYIQGTGLGLSICKAIIEKCGGQIGVDSELGKGSTFWFWVPAEIREMKMKEA